jgi:histidine ammonia-lyase
MIHLNGQKLTLQQIADVAYGREQVTLAEDARTRAEKARQVVEQIVAAGRTVYGVNTGFGKLSDVSIQSSELRELQLNLSVVIHADWHPLSKKQERCCYCGRTF